MTARNFRKLCTLVKASASRNEQNSSWWKVNPSWWKVVLTGGVSGFGLSALLRSTYIDKVRNIDEMKKDLKKYISPDDIKHSSTTSLKLHELQSKKRYINRPALEKQITSIVERTEASNRYFVVYGPKGVGKSILVSKCIDGKKGVLNVIISTVFKKTDILQMLSTEVMGEGASVINEKELLDVLYKSKIDDGRLPTLILKSSKEVLPSRPNVLIPYAACANSLQYVLIALLFFRKQMQFLCLDKTKLVSNSFSCPS